MAIAQNMNLARSARQNAPEIAGGATGVGLPVLLREVADVRNGQEFSLIDGRGDLAARLSRPSVAWGIGAGALTGALFLANAGPQWLRDFYLTHTVTGIPTGIASAAMPVEASGGNGGSGQTQRAVRERRGSTNNGRTGSEFDETGEFAEAE